MKKKHQDRQIERQTDRQAEASRNRDRPSKTDKHVQQNKEKLKEGIRVMKIQNKEKVRKKRGKGKEVMKLMIKGL